MMPRPLSLGRLVPMWLRQAIANRRSSQRHGETPAQIVHDAVATEGQDAVAVRDYDDERMTILRRELEKARVQMSLVEAEVQALRVDAGTIRRDYRAPARRGHEEEGHQPA